MRATIGSHAERSSIHARAPRLYLITPIVADPAAIGDRLDAALAVTDTAAVLLRLAATDERTLINGVKAVASTVQAQTSPCWSTATRIWSRVPARTAHICPAATPSCRRLAALKPQTALPA